MSRPLSYGRAVFFCCMIARHAHAYQLLTDLWVELACDPLGEYFSVLRSGREIGAFLSEIRVSGFFSNSNRMVCDIWP